MPRLIATKKLTYATKVLLPGAEFEASEEDSRLLCGFGSAKRKGKEIEPETSVSEPSRNKYRRRDMRAES